MTEKEWTVIKKVIPKQLGRPGNDDKNFVSALIWIAKAGCPWNQIPKADFGPWKSVYNRFNRWAKKGLIEEIFQTIKKSPPQLFR